MTRENPTQGGLEMAEITGSSSPDAVQRSGEDGALPVAVATAICKH